MVEPTESESLAEIDAFCDAMIAIRGEVDRSARGMRSTTIRCGARRIPPSACWSTSGSTPTPARSPPTRSARASGPRCGRRCAASTAPTATATWSARARRWSPTPDLHAAARIWAGTVSTSSVISPPNGSTVMLARSPRPRSPSRSPRVRLERSPKSVGPRQVGKVQVVEQGTQVQAVEQAGEVQVRLGWWLPNRRAGCPASDHRSRLEKPRSSQ